MLGLGLPASFSLYNHRGKLLLMLAPFHKRETEAQKDERIV